MEIVPLLTALPAVFALLLVPAGVRKVASPRDTGAALHTTGLPSDTRLVRALGAGEVALAAGVLLWPGPVALAGLALLYGAFAVFAERQRRRGADCGCFGRGAPATRLHVGVNAVAALAAAAAAAGAAEPLVELVRRDPGAGALAVALAAVGAALLRSLLTDVGDLAGAMRLHTAEADA